jgi:hypothetical protein
MKNIENKTNQSNDTSIALLLFSAKKSFELLE